MNSITETIAGQHFPLQRREERLRGSIVETRSDPAHRLPNPQLPAQLSAELTRAATEAGLESVTPHQLRHTFATALINSGVSLQALMAMLGHVSAEMSLRYGRLFDETVRADYERALTQANETPWFSRRLDLLDFDQGLVVP